MPEDRDTEIFIRAAHPPPPFRAGPRRRDRVNACCLQAVGVDAPGVAADTLRGKGKEPGGVEDRMQIYRGRNLET